MTKKLIILILIIVSLIGAVAFWFFRKPNFQLDKLYVSISQSDFEKLNQLRLHALDEGVLKRSKDDYVQCGVKFNSDSVAGKIRLKGDWVDHLNDEKWSFRVKLNEGIIDGMETFSLQSPKSRDFLNGYVFHRLLQHHHILSPKMTFVELMVNGESWGIYNFEEHLSSHLTSSQGRGDGIILYYEDELFFDAVQNNREIIGLIAKAKIKVKADKNIADDRVLMANAINILKNYQQQADSLYYDFHVEKMATYYAICDLARAYHAMGWINIRFFFDAKTQLVEPIGYDGYPIMDWGLPYLGHQAIKAKTTKHKLDQVKVVYSALYRPEIKEAYERILIDIVDETSIEAFKEGILPQINFFEAEIQKEFRRYSYDRTFINKNAEAIRAALIQDGKSI